MCDLSSETVNASWPWRRHAMASVTPPQPRTVSGGGGDGRGRPRCRFWRAVCAARDLRTVLVMSPEPPPPLPPPPPPHPTHPPRVSEVSKRNLTARLLFEPRNRWVVGDAPYLICRRKENGLYTKYLSYLVRTIREDWDGVRRVVFWVGWSAGGGDR